MRANRLFFLIPLALFGCTTEEPGKPADGGQFGEETGPHCKVQSETPLAWDEAVFFGATPQDLRDLTEGTHEATLTWNDASQTGLTVTVANVGNPRLLDYELEDDGSGIEPAIFCGDTVAIDVDLTVLTDDGQLDGTVAHTLELPEEGEVTTWIDTDDLGGTLDPTEWTSEPFDDVWADLELVFTDTGIAGAVNGYGEQTFGTGPDSAVSMTRFEIGTFGEALE